MTNVIPLPVPLSRPEVAYLATLSPGSRDTMSRCLERIRGITGKGWAELTYVDALNVRNTLERDGLGFRSINLHLAALRGVVRQAILLGGPDELARVVLVKCVKGSRELSGREVSLDEIRKLHDAACPRDRALLALLYGAGLRDHEARGAQLADYSRQDSTIKVVGKGNKERVVPLPCFASWLEPWFQTRGELPGPLLCPITRSGRVFLRPLSASAATRVLNDLAETCGLEHFSAHDLRRSILTHMGRAGVDILIRQRFAGHASVTTTQLYDRGTLDDVKKAAELMDPLKGGE